MLPSRKTSFGLFVLILVFSNVHSQEVLSKADGIFFNPDYCAATLYSEGHTYRGLKVKLNLVNNEVRFIKENSDEIEMSISFRVKKIEFGACGNKSNTVFQAGFPVISSRDDKDFLYQVLDSGKIFLLKSIRIFERTEAGASDIPYGHRAVNYDKHENYYAYTAATKTIQKIERTKEGIVKILGDKKEQVDKFIAENNIRVRGEEELLKVITFYNSLP